MPIYIGNTKLTNLQIGSTKIDKVFVGSTQVYPDTTIIGNILYNGYVINASNFCPTGWHIPSSAECNTLITYLGGESVAGGKMKEAGTTHWISPNTGATNSSGFTSLPNGKRSGGFSLKGYVNHIWTTWASGALLTTENNNTFGYVGAVSNMLIFGASVRLIKDNSTNPGTLTDYDGNVYNCITIGTQVWIQSDFKCTHLTNGIAIPLLQADESWATATSLGYSIYPD